MNLIASSARFKVYPYRGNKYQVTNRRLDRRYETDYERIGVFNTLSEALGFIQA